MKKLILATSNPGKLKEIEAYLAGLNWQLELKPAELEIEETGKTFSENAGLKAQSVALALGEWAIADDSGLAVEALGGAPGVYSARYGKTDQERIEKLLAALGDNPQRLARFVCAIAIARPDGSLVVEAEGFCEGEILSSPRGEGGFGYDPIFYVREYQLSFAEMSPQLKHKISHRAQAFDLILPRLKQL